MSDLHTQISTIMLSTVMAERPLTGGCVADVRLLTLADRRKIVVKRGAGLVLEARMLRRLATHSALPVPAVHHADDAIMVMDYIEAGDPIDESAESDAAEKLAALHNVTAATFGLEFETVIGGLAQPNGRQRSWRTFFRDRRLMYMAEEAHAADRLPAALLTRIGRLADHLDRWIGSDSEPSLIHGDLWGGNILICHGKLVGVVDPAISFSDPEMELAFTTLFNTFGKTFFARYHEIRPIASGFFEERRDLYNLYPLLVHARLFGGSHVSDVDRIVKRFGY